MTDRELYLGPLESLTIKAHCVLLLLGVSLAVHIITAIFFAKFASAQKRLAILELQGEVGRFTERQAWTDRMRAVAIDALSSTNISVIDREQLKLLINPERKLSDCVGMCAVELTRELGAQWSLSGSLIKDQSLKSGEVSLTLKLHSASGQTLAIQHAQGPLNEMIQKELTVLTRSVLNAGLLNEFKLQNEVNLQTSRVDVVPRSQDEDRKPYASQTTPRSKHTRRSSQWTRFKDGESVHCVSPLISHAQYQGCVDAQVCDPTPKTSRCVVSADEPVRCVNLQQALQYSHWKDGRLFTVNEWGEWAKSSQLDEALFEWLIPNLIHDSSISLRSSQIQKWQKEQLSLDRRALRQASPIKVYRSYGSQISDRRSPLAFALPDLSFRIVKQELSLCESMR